MRVSSYAPLTELTLADIEAGVVLITNDRDLRRVDELDVILLAGCVGG